MRATLAKTDDKTTARQSVAPLGDEGLPERDIQMIAGRRLGDVREEPVGGFAGPVSPDASVGSFGNVVRKRREGTGTFYGDSDRQRQGSFADADRLVMVTKAGGTERSRVTGDRGVRRLLREADVGGGAAEPRDGQARPEDIGHAA